MGEIRPHRPVLRLLAATSRHAEAIEWARRRAEGLWGPVALASDAFAFDETRFYESTMGVGLRKKFFAFQRLADPADLASAKTLTNQWEQDCRAEGRWPEPRPLNLDPGYLTEAKLILASTKDRDHRIYLGRGIYAEGTLYYQRGAWRTRPWTYPDYGRPSYHEYFSACRERLRRQLREGSL